MAAGEVKKISGVWYRELTSQQVIKLAERNRAQSDQFAVRITRLIEQKDTLDANQADLDTNATEAAK